MPGVIVDLEADVAEKGRPDAGGEEAERVHVFHDAQLALLADDVDDERLSTARRFWRGR
jgi:hypothetical protein